MKPDPAYLRRHYDSLSDEALLEIDRGDLVAVAQQCYDAEVSKRGLVRGGGAARPKEPRREVAQETFASETPEWMDDAIEAYSVIIDSHHRDEERIADARQIVEDAGLPCTIEKVEMTDAEREPVQATHRWRLMVPAKFGWQAVSTLERDLSNPEFEALWKTHLENCSDKDLPAMEPEIVFCGLFDRLERITKAYEEELARRGMR